MHAAPARLVRPAAYVAGLLGLVYAVLLVPGVRPTPGYSALIDVWLNMTVDAVVVVVLVLRSLAVRRDRAAWLLMSAGLAAAFAASTAYYTYLQHLEPIPSPSIADVGWLGFYVLLYAGLILLL